MMISRVARRYAEAIIQAIPENLTRPSFYQDVADLSGSLTQSRELQNFFHSPIISFEKKAETVQLLFTGKLSPYMMGVLNFLLEKNRENLISEIIEAMMEYKRNEDGILLATVKSAVMLDETQKGLLRSALEQVSQKSVEADFRVDPSLIGGVTVRMHDTVYDGSVSHQLHELRERFLTGN